MSISVISRFSLVAGMLFLSASAQAQTSPWAESYRLEAAGKLVEAQAPLESLGTELSALRLAYLTAIQGKYADAEKRYLKVLDTKPKSIPALVGVMNQQLAQQRYKDVIDTAQRVLKINAMDYTAQTNIMFSLWRISQWADLAKKVAEVAPYYPNDVAILVYGARAESALGRKPEARKMFARVLDLYPGHLEATEFLKATQ